jgi:hypothetical protein
MSGCSDSAYCVFQSEIGFGEKDRIARALVGEEVNEKIFHFRSRVLNERLF